MVFKRSKTLNFLVFVFLIMALVFTAFFAGCKKEEATEEKPIAVETEEVVEEIEEGEDVEKIAGIEITGDINIFSGLDISDEVGNSRPIAIMVENSPDSRPQSGLIYADMVYEAVDEGGVTRYVAVFSSNDAEIIGPVRSARIYYAEIARSFDPIYAFWGTYKEAYPVIEDMGLDVLTTLGEPLPAVSSIVANTSSGWRDYSRSNITEHTAFMSTIKLKEEAADYGYSLEGGQSPLRFKIDAVDSEREDISNININFSYDTYRVDFEYNRENNNYLKFTGGAPHTDYETGKRIAVNNVIVMITSIEGPIDQWGHMAVRTTGTSDIGKAFFFMDGNVIEGTWERTSAFDPFKYKDDDGNIVLFNRGSTWVALIQDTNRLK